MTTSELRSMEYVTGTQVSGNHSSAVLVVPPVGTDPNSSADDTVGYYDTFDGVNYTFLVNLSHTNATYSTNGTANHSAPGGDGQLYFSLTHLLVSSIVLGLMILSTIIGNVFVVAAIILERNLQSVANYLVMSLAVADLMVATLVMPISAVQEVTTNWFLGAEVCDMWISFDVLCCTASILHLVAIAIDRYWAVTQVDYIRQRTAKRIIIMIILVWTISICISIPPLFGWKDNHQNPYVSGQCLISQDWGYTVFSTSGAFYLPLFFMLIIYWKIFRAARSRIRKKKFGGGARSPAAPPKSVTINHDANSRTAPVETLNVVTVTQVSSSNSDSPDQPSNGSTTLPHLNDANRNNTNAAVTAAAPAKSKTKTEKPKDRNREKIEHKRERKAARTLAIITGAFVFCWVPFFLIALVGPFYKPNGKDIFPKILNSIVLWLGYFNSLLNPIIYTIFNPDFRNAFRKILFGKYRTRGGRRR
ncbi:5-hydroxytryptamine receptor-like [Tubulanus polymorphus]|uniref:5-hydroxytryptamine receptor-like n=1 Tax=Tubulanus polymorphus TaxID=672921 RepID=UPI003DA241CB